MKEDWMSGSMNKTLEIGDVVSILFSSGQLMKGMEITHVPLNQGEWWEFQSTGVWEIAGTRYGSDVIGTFAINPMSHDAVAIYKAERT